MNKFPFFDYLEPRGQSLSIGAENGAYIKDGVSKFDVISTPSERFISRRYVKSVDGCIISVVQVVSTDSGKTARIANAATLPEYRRMGHASDLLAAARTDFDSVEHSEDLSSDGLQFALNDLVQTSMLK